MPPLVAAAAVTGGAALIGGAASAKAQGSASRRAAEAQALSDRQALDYQKTQDAEQRREFDAQQAMAKSQWDATQAQQQQIDDRRQPYRDVSQAALMKLSDLFGIQMPSGGGGSSQPAQDTSAEQAAFQSIIAGQPATPETLVALEPQLNAAGFDVLRNAAGIAGKVKLKKNGVIADVGQAFSSGQPDQMKWQWLTGGGSAPRSSALSMNALMPTAAPLAPLAVNPTGTPYTPTIPLRALMRQGAR